MLHQHLEKLRHFVSTVDAGSFSAASSVLHLSQPTLSHSVKVLESMLGTELLLRTSRGVKLTATGEILFQEGKKLLEQSRRIEALIERRQSDKLSGVTIGTKEPYAVHLFPTYLQRLEARLPEVAISLTVRRSNDELVRLLLEENLEAIVIPDPPQHEELVAYPLLTDEYALYGRPASNPGPIYLFRQARCGGGRRIADVLGDSPARDVDSIEAARAMSLNGMGWALLPSLMAQEDVVSGRLEKKAHDAFPTRRFGTVRICLCVHAKNRRRKAYRAFVRAFLGLRRAAN